jgi:sirohydrochlorin cobaltochelatase
VGPPERAIIVLGHGSRDPLWCQPMEAVAERVSRGHPRVAVRCAYLELQPPDLQSTVAELVAAGAARVTVVPLFLGTGKHGREDLPHLIESLRQAHPTVEFHLQRPVGEDPRLLDLLAAIAAQ